MSAAPRNLFTGSLRLFADIARLRRGPEDLPVSTTLLVTTIVGSFLLSLMLSLLLPQRSARIAGPLLVDALLTLLWLAVLLRMARRPERFLQTATAVFGFHLVLAPLIAVLQALLGRYGQDPSWQIPLLLMVLSMVGWTLAVSVRILASATGWPVYLCVAVMLLQELVEWSVLMVLFPELTATAPAVA